MHKNLLSTFLPLLFFIMISPIYSQTLIYENSNSSGETFKMRKEIDETQYSKKLCNAFQTVYVKNDTLQNATKNTDSLLNLTLDGPNDYLIIVLIYNDDNSYNQPFILANHETQLEVNLPDGVYDIWVTFFEYLPVPTLFHVVKELEVIDGNTIMTIHKDEAINRIVYENYKEGGEEFLPDVNCQFIYSDQIFMFNPTGRILFSSGAEWADGNSEFPAGTFYINNLSNRYKIIEQPIVVVDNETFYFPAHENITEISSSLTINNDFEVWNYVEQDPIKLTPFGEIGDRLSGFQFYLTYQNYSVSNIGYTLSEYFPDQSIRTAFNPTTEEGKAPIFSIFAHEYSSPTGWPIGVGANFLYPDTEGIVKFGSGSVKRYVSHLNGHLYNQNNHRYLIPGNNKFSYFPNQLSGQKTGNSSPVLITGILGQNRIYSSYLGRLGEERETDLLINNVTVFRNNSVDFTGNYYSFNESYGFNSSDEFRVEFENTNIKVDELLGKNHTILEFDQSNEDWVPPTVQMLQFRNTDGLIKDHFNPGEQGVLMLSAGDFYFIWNEELYRYNLHYKEENTVDLFYSKLNEENWTVLELTKYPEHFHMPKFGDYYEASLSGIVPDGNDVWYDVKIICTDDAGNKQTQIISPAFKLNDTLGIDDTSTSDFTVYPNPFENELFVQLPENIIGKINLKLTDLTGKVISTEYYEASEKISWDGSFLPKGIYILSIEKEGEILTKKVIKK